MTTFSPEDPCAKSSRAVKMSEIAFSEFSDVPSEMKHDVLYGKVG